MQKISYFAQVVPSSQNDLTLPSLLTDFSIITITKNLHRVTPAPSSLPMN